MAWTTFVRNRILVPRITVLYCTALLPLLPPGPRPAGPPGPLRVRAMCSPSRQDVRDDICGHKTLYARLNVPCVLRLISNRKLRWAGHVARMDMHRLPRKFLSSWVKDVPRPRGRAQSYGHDLSRELNGIGFNLLTGATMLGVSRDWLTVAQDRDAWRVLVEPLRHVEANPISSQSKSSGRGQSELQSAPLRGLTGFDPRH